MTRVVKAASVPSTGRERAPFSRRGGACPRAGAPGTPAVGRVARRCAGGRQARSINSPSRARASARLRSWVRWRAPRCTSTPSAVRRLPASAARRAFTAGEQPRAAQVEAQAHRGLDLVYVLAAGPRGAEELEGDLAGALERLDGDRGSCARPLGPPRPPAAGRREHDHRRAPAAREPERAARRLQRRRAGAAAQRPVQDHRQEELRLALARPASPRRRRPARSRGGRRA